MAEYTDQTGKRIILGSLLGSGGEGSVYLILGDLNSVAKIYIPAKRNFYQDRLMTMVTNPPQDATRSLNPPHISIAWPEKCLYQNGRFVGYIMPYIQKSPDIFKVYAPTLRKAVLPGFTWFHLHHVALNLAIAVQAYHSAGYIIGDLNSKNIKVNPNAMVTMIDTDSVQMRTSSGKILFCPVGVPDFTPPELQGRSLSGIQRDEYHDDFALAVMIFLLLMEGNHPFNGKPTDPFFSTPLPVYQYCMMNNLFPYVSNGRFIPPKNAPEFTNLHPDIQRLFVKCFSQSSGNLRTNRPTPKEWYITLKNVESQLTRCSYGHAYFASNGTSCPWCRREAKLHPNVKPNQQPIKPKSSPFPKMVLKAPKFIIPNKTPGLIKQSRVKRNYSKSVDIHTKLKRAGIGAFIYFLVFLLTQKLGITAAIRPGMVIPIFMGIVFGPLVGFISGFVGSVVSDLLLGYGFWFWWYIGTGLTGLIPGIIFNKILRERTPKYFFKVELFSSLAIMIGMGLSIISELWVTHTEWNVVANVYFPEVILLDIANALVLMPALMLIFNAIFN